VNIFGTYICLSLLEIGKNKLAMLKKQITSFYSSDMAKCGNVTLNRLGDAISNCCNSHMNKANLIINAIYLDLYVNQATHFYNFQKIAT